MTKEREGELLMVGLALLESWFPILSIVVISHIGALIMGVGAMIILFPKELELNKGDLLILIAAAIAPIANFYSKRTRKHCSSETILGFRTLFALPVVAFFAWIIEPEISYANMYEALPYVVLIGLLIFGVSKIMWMEALHRATITKISAMMALVPMLTLLFAYLYLSEVPEIRQILGIVPVLVGGYLLTKAIE